MAGLTFDGGPDVEERASRIVDRTTLGRRQADLVALLEEGVSRAGAAEILDLGRGTVDAMVYQLREKRDVARATVEETARALEGEN